MTVNLHAARLLWDGTALRLAGIDAGVEENLTPWATVSGELEGELVVGEFGVSGRRNTVSRGSSRIFRTRAASWIWKAAWRRRERESS